MITRRDVRIVPPMEEDTSIHVVSVCFVFDQNDRVLLGKRNMDPWKGEWAAPGGALKHYELFSECASRELLEETGIQLSGNPTLFGVREYLSPEGVHLIAGIHTANVMDNTEVKLLEPDKCEGWEWFDKDSVPKSEVPSMQALPYIYRAMPKRYDCEKCGNRSPARCWGPGWIKCPVCSFVARTLYEKQHGLRAP